MSPPSPCARSSASPALQDLGEGSAARLQRVPNDPPAGVAVPIDERGALVLAPGAPGGAQFARDVRDGSENRSICPYTWRSTTHT
jgi:hypothetical protein